MIYSNQEMILMSLIYSDITEGRFASPKLSHKALYAVFNYSLEQNINFLEIKNISELKIFFVNSIKKLKETSQIRDEEKYIEELSLYFIENKDKIDIFQERVIKELELCEIHNIKYETYFSEKYPISFKELKDPPFVIFYKGILPKNKELEKSLAIIGTRNPEEQYGREVARRIGQLLLEEGWWNISGLAMGCDEYGHIGSLGATGAILAHGLVQQIFPKENIKLAEDIISNGGFLLSELPPSTKLAPLFLVLRDRLQSGMTKGIFVVETSEKSGTLHTVKYSLEQKRFTLVWDPSDTKLNNCKEVKGNLILIEKEKGTLSPVVPKKFYSNIIGIKNSEELKSKLEMIEKKVFKYNSEKKELKPIEQTKIF